MMVRRVLSNIKTKTFHIYNLLELYLKKLPPQSTLARYNQFGPVWGDKICQGAPLFQSVTKSSIDSSESVTKEASESFSGG